MLPQCQSALMSTGTIHHGRDPRLLTGDQLLSPTLYRDLVLDDRLAGLRMIRGGGLAEPELLFERVAHLGR